MPLAEIIILDALAYANDSCFLSKSKVTKIIINFHWNINIKVLTMIFTQTLCNINDILKNLP